MNGQADWNDAVGLWRKPGPGHTVPTGDCAVVHAGPDAAVRLLRFAEAGMLNAVPAARVLGALAELQDPATGCMRWYHEEERVIDTNAAFFTGLPLIVLWRRHAAELTPETFERLKNVCGGLYGWFRAQVSGPFHAFYPNKWLGDLTCVWLLHELLDRKEDQRLLTSALQQAAAYWREHQWGWGEHMSDGYATVLLDELSLLLLLSERLPATLRREYLDLLNRLLAIEDAFGDGPRVPALRAYAFRETPRPVRYRDRVRPSDGPPLTAGNLLVTGPLLHSLGWHARVAPPKPGGARVSIACFGGRAAEAYVAPDVRLGVMTDFPIMPGAEHVAWGLCWQSFPACFWRPEGDWGFLQWETLEAGRVAAHPAHDKNFASLEHALSRAVYPPLLGRTCGLMCGTGLLALRLMPVVSQSWDRLTDRFRLIASHARPEVRVEGAWSQLILKYPERAVTVRRLDLCGAVPVLHTDGSTLDWTCSLAGPLGENTMVSLWSIDLHGGFLPAPRLEPAGPAQPRNPAEQAWRIAWPGPDGPIVLIDPLAASPLQSINVEGLPFEVTPSR